MICSFNGQPISAVIPSPAPPPFDETHPVHLAFIKLNECFLVPENKATCRALPTVALFSSTYKSLVAVVVEL